jgi:PAS domain-containing protein
MKQWELRGVTVQASGAPAVAAPDRASRSVRMLWDQIPAVLWTTDSDLVFTSSLGARLALLGLGPNQLAGEGLSVLFGGDNEPLRAHRRALGGESVAFEIKWSDGTYRARVGPLRDSIGQIIGTICIALDENELGGRRDHRKSRMKAR